MVRQSGGGGDRFDAGRRGAKSKGTGSREKSAKRLKRLGEGRRRETPRTFPFGFCACSLLFVFCFPPLAFRFLLPASAIQLQLRRAEHARHGIPPDRGDRATVAEVL